MPAPTTEDSAAPLTQALPSGSRLEEFVIEQVLGSGGFGITYLARDSRLGRRVVIKENLPTQFCWREPSSLTVQPRHSKGEDADNFQYSLESFEREASTLASLDHPGIVKVLRSFEAHGTAYFVMPFVEGTALDEVLRQRNEQSQAFAENEIKDLLAKVLDALGYLHDRGIYHRDIKPGNILVTTAGEPVLIDFGAARQRLSERSLTVIESAGYTPFEQLQSRGKVGPWSDIYALGGTLCKALTGETPAKANDRAFDDPLVPLAQRAELRGHYSARLLESIDKAMAPKATDRFQDTVQWRDCLGTSKAPSPPAREPAVAPPSPAAHTSSANSLHEEHRQILAEATAAIARNDSRAAISLFEQLETKRFVDLDYSKVKKYVLQRKERRTNLVVAAIILVLVFVFFGQMLNSSSTEPLKGDATEQAQDATEATRLAQQNATAETARIAQEKTDTENKQKHKITVATNPTKAADPSKIQQPARIELPDQKAAAAGDMEAQFRMGMAYATGRGVPQDDQIAMAWLENASAQGHKEAELQLQNFRESRRTQSPVSSGSTSPLSTGKRGWEIVKIDERDYVTGDSILNFYQVAGISTYKFTSPDIWFRGNNLIMKAQVGSAELLINNVKFILSFPVLESEGKALFSKLDLTALLDPVLRPSYATKAEPFAFDTVVVDAARGGNENGIRGVYGDEKDFTLKLGAEVKASLEKRGFKVVMTRDGDQTLKDSERVAIANATSNSIFISLAFGSGREDERGIETFALAPEGSSAGNQHNSKNIALATAVHARVVSTYKLIDRGIKRSEASLLAGCMRPGIVFVGGFITDAKEGRLIASDTYRRAVAETIGEAVVNFRKATRSGSSHSSVEKNGHE